jgi:hypothetical protein
MEAPLRLEHSKSNVLERYGRDKCASVRSNRKDGSAQFGANRPKNLRTPAIILRTNVAAQHLSPLGNLTPRTLADSTVGPFLP